LRREEIMLPSLRRLIVVLVPAMLVACSAAHSQRAGVTNSPYTATEKTTFVQNLADGTTITRTSTRIQARDSEGRTMQQSKPLGTFGEFSPVFTNTFIMDPVARTTTVWMAPGNTATRTHMPDLSTQHRAVVLGVSGSSSMGSGSGSGVTGYSGSVGLSGAVSAAPSTGFSKDPATRPQHHTEKLGSKAIAGLYVEGTRNTTIYPVGFFGNDRPITVVGETWMSPDLKLVLSSTNSDPRNGTTTTEVIDLQRAEPDPALFQIPEGYTLKDQNPGSN
jgi:hypothetical protein